MSDILFSMHIVKFAGTSQLFNEWCIVVDKKQTSKKNTCLCFLLLPATRGSGGK